jgi:hypothetical protein
MTVSSCPVVRGRAARVLRHRAEAHRAGDTPRAPDERVNAELKTCSRWRVRGERAALTWVCVAPLNASRGSAVPGDMILNEPTYKPFRPNLPHPTRADFEEALRPLNSLPVATVDVSDISNAILYLVSDARRYVTGTTHVVDAGGQLCWRAPRRLRPDRRARPFKAARDGERWDTAPPLTGGRARGCPGRLPVEPGGRGTASGCLATQSAQHGRRRGPPPSVVGLTPHGRGGK